VAADDAYSLFQDSSLTVIPTGVLGNDTDADGDPLTAALIAGAAHGSVTLNADGSFTYTPSAGYVGGDSFTYLANDGTADSNLATVWLTVNAHVNHRPVAVNDVYSVSQDSSLVLPSSGVLTNDTDADGDSLTAVLFKGPQHGTLALNSDGSLNYTPNAGYSGADSFSYQADDGHLKSTLAAVTIHVVAPLWLAPGTPTLAGGDALTSTELSLFVAEGLARWETVAPLAVQHLGPIAASIGDLPGDMLGSTEGARIQIDVNAAGRGWFIDPTPADDDEFLLGADALLSARPGSAADGRVDLLSVVMHELGHVLGLADLDPTAYPEDLMAAELSPGIRKDPGSAAVDAIFGGGV
jgi:VCBS repeat-containing protein